MPDLRTETGGLNLNFTTGLETVFAERFALRAQLVTADSLLKAGLFATGIDQVIVGRDGYLFFGETLADLAVVEIAERNLRDLIGADARIAD